MQRLKRPGAAGLYDPNFEHDACGVGAVACLSGEARHATVLRALDVLDRLEHRGASGAEIDTGDGAGILLQTPHEFLRRGRRLRAARARAPTPSACCFLPRDARERAEVERIVEDAIGAAGQKLLGWRDVPVDHSVPGPSAAAVEPVIRQVFVGSTLDDQLTPSSARST